MIAFILASCFNSTSPQSVDLPEKRAPEPVKSHKIQYGELKGHLFSMGKTTTEGMVLLGANATDSCIPDQITSGQKILLLDNAEQQEKARDYLSKQTNGRVSIATLNSFCKSNP